MDFFERQHLAQKQTKKLVFYFILAVLLIIATLNAVGYFILKATDPALLGNGPWLLNPFSLGITAGVILVIIIGSLSRHWQVRGGGKAVAQMVGARQVDMSSRDSQERRLINVVEEMSIASGMPVPGIYVLDNELGMNAFVAGLIPSDTVLVVTEGLLKTLKRQELQGVVAHEFSHIFHADMRINVRLISILGGILAIGQLGYYVLRSMRFTGGRRRSSRSGGSGQAMIFILALSISLITVGYIGLFFGRLIKAAISRQREYLADAAAVQYSRDAMGIANALYKIKTNGKGSLLDSSHAEDMSHMCFGKSLEVTAFSGMLATHPPIDDRIQALVPGYRSIRRQKGEQTVDDLSPIAQFAGASHSAVTQTEPAMMNSANDLVASIGTVNPESFHHAEQILSELPEAYLNAAHSLSEVGHLVLALIAQSNKIPWSEQREALNNRLSENELQAIENISTVKISEEQKLPLVEIALPTLKQLSADEAKQLLANSSVLIVADKSINVFEFFLYALLRKHLAEQDADFQSGKLKKYSQVSEELIYLIQVLALVGDTAEHAVIVQHIHSFYPSWDGHTMGIKFEAKRLHESLSKLNRLTPMLKKPIMQALAELVIADGQIKTTELELLRATGIYLDCPIPPVMQLKDAKDH